MPGTAYPLAALEADSRRIYASMERFGLRADVERLDGIIVDLRSTRDQLQTQGESLTGLSISPDRPEEIARAAEHLGVKLPRTATGRVRTDQATLAAYTGLAPIAQLKRIRCQLSVAYGVAQRVVQGRLWPRYVFSDVLGRPHTAMVNYMAWPIGLRPVLLPETGHRFVVADFDSMELRVLAALSGDADLQRALTEPDFHRGTASRLFGTPLAAISDEQRQTAKTLTYAFLYGSTPASLIRRMAIDQNCIEAFMRRWEDAYPQAAAFIRQVQRDSVRRRWVDSFHGRRRCLKDLVAANPAKARRLAINHLIQSTAADLMRIGLIHLWPNLQERGGRVLGTFHDSYLLSVPQEVSVDDLLAIIRATVIDQNEPGFSLKIKVSVGPRWGEIEQENGV